MRFVIVFSVALIALFFVVAVLSTAVFLNVSKIAANERETARNSRVAAFRICERGNLTRAEIHATIRQALGLEALAQRQQRLPISDCSPNSEGSAAVRLVPDEQTAYLNFYLAHNGVPPRVVEGHVTNEPLRPNEYQLEPEP